MDWDQFTFWHAVPREIILRHGQFPLWNPYANGGNVLLAHPQSAFLSPFFIFVLLGGPILGLKLEIFAHLWLGLLGMHSLSRHLGLNWRAAYLSACVYMLSSVFFLHLGEGQMEWVALAFVPWIFMFYLKSIPPARLRNPEPCVPNHFSLAGAVLTLGLILVTGVYVVNLFLLFLFVYAGLTAVQMRQGRPLWTLGIVFAGACLIGAVKFLPMLEFVHQVPRLVDQQSGVSPETLWTMLFGRNQAFLDSRLWETTFLPDGTYRYGWHEYGAYIGFLPILLFMMGGIREYKTRWPLLGSAAVCLLLVMGHSSPVNLWGMLHHVPIYRSLTVPSRFIFCVIFPVALFSGFGLAHVENGLRKYGRVVSCLILVFVTLDLWQVNGVLLKNVFRIPPQHVARETVFRQRYAAVNFYKEKSLSRSSQYPIFLSNSGVLEAYECAAVKRGDVRIASDPGYRGEAYLKSGNGRILDVHFSPNAIGVSVDMDGNDTLIVNQNYYSGWRVRANGNDLRPAVYNGLTAARLGAGRQDVVFYYLPGSFILGLCLSLSFAVTLILWLARGLKAPASS